MFSSENKQLVEKQESCTELRRNKKKKHCLVIYVHVHVYTACKCIFGSQKENCFICEQGN